MDYEMNKREKSDAKLSKSESNLDVYLYAHTSHTTYDTAYIQCVIVFFASLFFHDHPFPTIHKPIALNALYTHLICAQISDC